MRGVNLESGVLTPLDVPPTVEDSVYTRLRESVVSQEIPPGTRLAQREVARFLGVSQTPVRAALRRLESEGFVEPSGGTAIVSQLTREGYQEIMAARLGLESLAARLGAPLLEAESVSSMRLLLEKLERLGKTGDAQGYYHARWSLHHTCYLAARRPRLLADVERQFYRSERYSLEIFASPELTSKAQLFYADFVECCARRDGAAAESSIFASIRWGFDELADLWPSEGEDDSSAATTP